MFTDYALIAAPYLRNKSSFRREEAPTVEDDDDYESALPSITMTPGRGMKIRIPPPLMPDEESANRYFDLYFAQVHPFVPVLDQNQFYRQWRTNPSSISPLILEAIFAIGGRLAEDPGDGQQWLALASRKWTEFLNPISIKFASYLTSYKGTLISSWTFQD